MAYPNGLDFNNVYPYNAIEAVTRDGQKMVKIPKFYVKGGLAPEGSQLAGKRVWMIAENKEDGYHCHPAFMRAGQELDYFLIGAYEASNDGSGKPQSLPGKTPWVNINTPDAISAGTKRNTGTGEQAGWHIESVYEYQAISLLMLIEMGAPDVQSIIGNGNSSNSACVATGTTNAVWRGIYDHWADAWEICDGLKTGASGQVLIWDKNGNQTYVDTGKVVADKGFASGSTDQYSLDELFIPSDDGSGKAFSASTADGVWTGSNTVLYLGGSWDDGAIDGLFAFAVSLGASGSYSSVGFRLAKYDL